MVNGKRLIVSLAIFAVVMVGAYLLYAQLAPEFSPDQLATVGTQAHEATEHTSPQETVENTHAQEPNQNLAPNFTVYDAQGNAVQLSDYFGKPIVLNFWASWCGPCQMEMPAFESKYQELGSTVQFLMVNMTDGERETVGIASGFITQKGYTFPVLFDMQYSAALAYNVYSLPTTFFIYANGQVAAYASGAINEQILQQGIDMITP